MRSDKGVDKLLPTDLSVANLMHDKIEAGEESIEYGETGNSMVSLVVSMNGQLQKRSFSIAGDPSLQKVSSLIGSGSPSLKHKRNSSMPPQMMIVKSPTTDTMAQDTLPELNATRAKIEQHIYKSPIRK